MIYIIYFDTNLFVFNLNTLKLISRNMQGMAEELASMIYDSWSPELKDACLIYEVGVEKYDLKDFCVTYLFRLSDLKKCSTLTSLDSLCEFIKTMYGLEVEYKELGDDTGHLYVYLLKKTIIGESIWNLQP